MARCKCFMIQRRLALLPERSKWAFVNAMGTQAATLMGPVNLESREVAALMLAEFRVSYPDHEYRIVPITVAD